MKAPARLLPHDDAAALPPGSEAPRPSASGGPRAARLPGGRLHLNHGPIDLVIAVDGTPDEVRRAEAQALEGFGPVLAGLVAELPALRTPVGPVRPLVSGRVGQAMVDAVWPYRGQFITPMAAVAGSVAQHVLACLTAERALRRASVNNGGDIALRLAPGERVTLGVVARLAAPAIERRVLVTAESGVRGIATSGWGGRSFSLGIADAVTVFAADAPAADAAATVVANAVNVDHAGVRRAPARTIQPDTDLGALPVTVAVDIREPAAWSAALDAGARVAERWIAEGTILGALLFAGGQSRALGWTGAGE
jgi:ApbE superfamily uncharacterized protein (UPF0280 family)